MISRFKSVPQQSGKAISFDDLFSVVVRLNQYIQAGVVFYRSSGDYDNALNQLDLFALLNHLSIQLIKDIKNNRANHEIWSMLNEYLNAIKTRSPNNAYNSLHKKWKEWRTNHSRVINVVGASTSRSKTTGVLVTPPGAQISCVKDPSPILEQNIVKKDPVPNDDKEAPATDTAESIISQSSPSSDESNIVDAPNFKVIITNEDNKRLVELLRCAMDHVIVKKFNLEMRRSDIRTLHGSNWLNDNVINFYMELLAERSQLTAHSAGALPSVYAMNSYFLQRLLTIGYSAVKRWTRKVDLFRKDIIAVPVHFDGQPAHWSMAIVDMRHNTIRYYDSMGQENHDVLYALLDYLQEESKDKRHYKIDTSDFKIENVEDVPRQSNGNDCGVFCCMFAEFVTRDAPLVFNQKHMAALRKKMMLEIIDGKMRT